jgi:hypothetical protein
VPCRRRDPLWTPNKPGLEEAYRLPGLGDLDGRVAWADVRGAWSEAGLVFSVEVRGKRRAPWCRPLQCEDSDGLQLWIDTRNVHDVHRAGRFCHRFAILPTDPPHCAWLPINRAREQPRPVPPDALEARCRPRRDGYQLSALVGAEALTGFDPAEHPRLGFTYAVLDRELGEQTFAVGSPMQYQEDPSLWATLELER